MSQGIGIQSQETIGETIRRLCDRDGRKIWWIASQLGVSTSTLLSVLSGKRDLRAREVAQLATIFAVPAETFLPTEATNEPTT